MSQGLVAKCEFEGLDCPYCGNDMPIFAVQQVLSEYDSFEDVDWEEMACPSCQETFRVSVNLDIRYQPEPEYTQQNLFKCYEG